LRRLAGHRLTADGVIVITAARFRTQARNREDARDRLVELIRQAAAPPPRPRRATKPTYASTVRRRDAKRRHGAVKALRRVRSDDD
jgi:ribosome-associated protein